ncbi:MAG: caspase family protein [Deltaproteobacteria bacterium]|nr:caspase family protein [Deltaproteobacteria bacterium]
MAVMVGISRYRDPKIPSIQYAASDARSVAALLRSPMGWNLPDDKIRVLTDESASLTEIKKATTFLAREADKSTTVLFYFAGHGGVEADLSGGEPDGWAKYLVPFDADSKDLYSSALSMRKDIPEMLDRIKAGKVIFLLDTCFGGGVGRAFVSEKTRTRDIRVVPVQKLDFAWQERAVLMAAAGPSQVALEDDVTRHGLFTQYFLEGSTGAADSNHDGQISVEELYNYVAGRVEARARELGSTQVPSVQGTWDLRKLVLFRPLRF